MGHHSAICGHRSFYTQVLPATRVCHNYTSVCWCCTSQPLMCLHRLCDAQIKEKILLRLSCLTKACIMHLYNNGKVGKQRKGSETKTWLHLTERGLGCFHASKCIKQWQVHSLWQAKC